MKLIKKVMILAIVFASFLIFACAKQEKAVVEEANVENVVEEPVQEVEEVEENVE
ncbi:MAG: hypothetical protein RBS16_05675 [Candidatus Cloacimonadales bacterium]|jgi:hypothetical protein|nr:hypothetical protein [Candidatus Cloacimonadota bacterium]MDD2649682.1 hypothetical protein [Candidatus Cloacimonadota bacterium]MDD3502052.1 hypothetical protein [Candidatus Cloacimonadota bacterium]MDX9977510.1 hypothetical protein [Candidatus Cloacimonadales bacterium]